MSTKTAVPTETHLFKLHIPMNVEAKMPKFYALRQVQGGIYASVIFFLGFLYLFNTAGMESAVGMLLGTVLVTAFTVISYFKAPFGWIKRNTQEFIASNATQDLAKQVQETLDPLYQIERKYDYADGEGSYINAPFDDLATNTTMIEIMIVRAWENYRMVASGKKSYDSYVRDNWVGFASFGDDKTYHFDPKFLDAHTYIVETYVFDSENN